MRAQSWTATFPGSLFERLAAHLFPGDGHAHAAVIGAGIVSTVRGTRLLARELVLARDGIDYVAGRTGHHMLTAGFVGHQIRRLRDEGLVYLAVHNHGGSGLVGFSQTDLASHERGYPALLDISGGPVGALVLADGAVAGDIWTPDRARRELSEVVVLGRSIARLHPAPLARPAQSDPMWDRQSRWFGDRGQELLGRLKVGVIGAGGVGLPLVTMLARLGVGALAVIDPDRVDPINLPRLDARRLDAMMPLRRHDLLEPLARRLSTRKVDLARRVARRANPKLRFAAIGRNVVEPSAARALVDADFLFLAADSHQARMVFNAIVHQYLVPGIQIGTRIDIDGDGVVGDIRSNVRLVTPDRGCLRCNRLIDRTKVQIESQSANERRRNRYVDDVPAASVITFNMMSAAQAMNDFLLLLGGFIEASAPLDYLRIRPRERKMEPVVAVASEARCRDCGPEPRSRVARGDGVALPLPERVGRPWNKSRLGSGATVDR